MHYLPTVAALIGLLTGTSLGYALNSNSSTKALPSRSDTDWKKSYCWHEFGYSAGDQESTMGYPVKKADVECLGNCQLAGGKCSFFEGYDFPICACSDVEYPGGEKPPKEVDPPAETFQETPESPNWRATYCSFPFGLEPTFDSDDDGSTSAFPVEKAEKECAGNCQLAGGECTILEGSTYPMCKCPSSTCGQKFDSEEACKQHCYPELGKVATCNQRSFVHQLHPYQCDCTDIPISN
jgi:hypothetical protein